MDPQKIERFGQLSMQTMQRLGKGGAPSPQDDVVLAVSSLGEDVMADRKISPEEARKLLSQVREAMCGAGKAGGAVCEQVARDVAALEAAYEASGEAPPETVPAALQLMAAVVAWIDGRSTGKAEPGRAG